MIRASDEQLDVFNKVRCNPLLHTGQAAKGRIFNPVHCN